MVFSPLVEDSRGRVFKRVQARSSVFGGGRVRVRVRGGASIGNSAALNFLSR